MIILRKISLFQFRNYAQSAYSIDNPILCITGKNGSGKTNFLDAVYTLCYTKSYFTAGIQATIMYGREGYRIEGQFEQNSKKETVICKYKNAKKEISCGGVLYERQADHIGKYAAVMIAPDDIEMINEGSELRRKFVDSVLSQSNKTYFKALLQYQKVLQQRNAWLKMYNNSTAIDDTLIDYYNQVLAQCGSLIFDARNAFWKVFLPMLQKYYQQLSGVQELASIEYRSDLQQQSLALWLDQQLQHDIRYQRTLRGIHKDDFIFMLQGMPLKHYGSQGQKKSFLFALKLAQFEFLKQYMNISPILLLDDIFEKLDQQRMESLLNIIQSPIFGQVLMTDTHENRVQEAFGKEKKYWFYQIINRNPYMKKSLIVVLIIALAAAYGLNSKGKRAYGQVLRYDVSGYYLYLPALFIYQDLGTLAFMPQIEERYRPADDCKNYGLYEHKKTGLKSNKYAIGLAIGELPFFAIAHQYAKATSEKNPVDGYSEPYQFAIAISTIFWSLLGLFILAAFLRRHFSDTVSAFCILIIGLGTNLYCYTWAESGMSHSFVFMLYAAVLYYTDKWYDQHKIKHALGLGLMLGWVLITRPVDFTIVLIPLLWPSGASMPKAKSRWAFWWQYKTHLLACAISCFMVSIIQLAYWKYTTGHFIHFSYEEEGFIFSEPAIFDGLFSFKKGWFVYTPIAFIGLLGLIPLYRQNKKMILPILLFYSITIYIIFSWHQWWYGWGFGSRPMIESYAVLSIPLAALMHWTGQQKVLLKSTVVAVFGFFIWLNLYQTEQYTMGAIQGDNMNRAFYWRVWNKMHPSEEDWKYFNP